MYMQREMYPRHYKNIFRYAKFQKTYFQYIDLAPCRMKFMGLKLYY